MLISLCLSCAQLVMFLFLLFFLLLQLEDKKESKPEVSISSTNESGKKERARSLDTFRG